MTFIPKISVSGQKRNSGVYYEPVMLRSSILLLQPSPGCIHILEKILGSWPDPMSNVSPGTIRSGRRFTLHCPGYHHQQIRHDLSPKNLPQVSINYIDKSKCFLYSSCGLFCSFCYQVIQAAVFSSYGGQHLDLLIWSIDSNIPRKMGAIWLRPNNWLLFYSTRPKWKIS